jgi:hypothetical protein
MEMAQMLGKYSVLPENFQNTCKMSTKYLYYKSTGLGAYLAEVDPQNREKDWQLKNILVFCQVHFFRNITKTVGPRQSSFGIWQRMASILKAKSESDYYELLDLIGK